MRQEGAMRGRWTAVLLLGVLLSFATIGFGQRSRVAAQTGLAPTSTSSTVGLGGWQAPFASSQQGQQSDAYLLPDFKLPWHENWNAII